MIRRLSLILVAGSLGIGLATCGGGGSEGDVDQPDAEDARTKTATRIAQTALETYYVESASYEGATVETLAQLEPTITDFPVTLSVSPSSYEITGESPTGNKFTVSKDESGIVTLSCEEQGEAGCPDGGQW